MGALTFQESHIEADGFRIKYLAAGQGDPVAILDSISGGISKLQDALVQRYRVIVLELPGFGSSPANTKSSSAKDLSKVVAQATEKIIPEKYTLIGTSFGANVALWHTLQSPDRVDALVLISPTTLLPKGNPAADDREISAKEQELISRLDGKLHDGEAESRLSEIQCPTLVVFGSKDGLVAAGAASTYRREIPNCHVSLVYDTGRLIEAERPEALINTV
ncbi:MAG: alpha/beta hydrolase, partial [Chloroflexi bacterium]|nr:alpha/beta hydrolase [Chloroflexota bacterium]